MTVHPQPRVRAATSSPGPTHLPRGFFSRPTLDVAKELLGQRLVRVDRGSRVSGWIVETEAYVGARDLGCHARVGRTPRNEVMWGPAGHAYVYFTHGMHLCLNVVTEEVAFPAAVLIRALRPDEGRLRMRRRRGAVPEVHLVDGPAKLCQALGIDGIFTGHDFCAADARLFIESGRGLPDGEVTVGPRVGLNTVPEPWKSKPWRFRLLTPNPP